MLCVNYMKAYQKCQGGLRMYRTLIVQKIYKYVHLFTLGGW